MTQQFLEVYISEVHASVKKIYMRMFIVLLFERATNWKLPKCSLIVEWINKKSEIYENKIFYDNGKE